MNNAGTLFSARSIDLNGPPMLLDSADIRRIEANRQLNPKTKSSLGQFMTPSTICEFMASLFDEISGDVRVLDPGCGVGSLTAAFCDEAISRGHSMVRATAYDIEPVMQPFLQETLNDCSERIGEDFKFDIRNADFIHAAAEMLSADLFGSTGEQFTHVIMNPPYKKIATAGDHRKSLRRAGIETVNLYSGFVALAVKLLQDGGELVAIVPRSFCNGPYYQPFRECLLGETAITRIHIFDKRNTAFSDDEVLQENVIFHCKKGAEQRSVTVTSSPTSDFHFDTHSEQMTATDMTVREMAFDRLVNPNDPQKFIHIAATPRDQAVIDRLSGFNSTLEDLEVQVSTGPVVNFRLRDDLRDKQCEGSVPLLFPQHLNGGVKWPLTDSNKPNAIMVSNESKPWLWENKGHFLITKRFSAKEERRRIVATLYDSSLPGKLIGFENKTNVFHWKKVGLNDDISKGLFVYLNSTLLDKYYRQFGGHTQVNAADLRSLHYPDRETLIRMGRKVQSQDITQQEIDGILGSEIKSMADDNIVDPIRAKAKIEQALEVLKLLGMPRAQQNERSALTLLALLNLRPEGEWSQIERPMIGVTPIMDWCRDVYGTEYAPNTRETFRRQTLHQFNDGGITLYNPDKPDRPVNSPKACYQITEELHKVLALCGTAEFAGALKAHLEHVKTLAEQYAKAREMAMVPVVLEDGTEIRLSPGAHSQLIGDIVAEFAPRFAPGSEVIYLGDTGAKEDFFRKNRLEELGVIVDRKGKLPDVVLYWEEKDWLLLIESVTSHGPVDGKRHGELSRLFEQASPGLVYVTAFPDRRIMTKYLSEISWETEVWIADAPTHMIHFNGDRFLGPHD
ncbi:MAG: BsuBI/PstI family type II restriction endonuclease [Roseibium sp.]|uniref:BsuBI/PstI family type II restriction endonuclease n=1 Tax=Roseibium sp. TaxID=1936156 RepID=UPI003D9C496D